MKTYRIIEVKLYKTLFVMTTTFIYHFTDIKTEKESKKAIAISQIIS